MNGETCHSILLKMKKKKLIQLPAIEFWYELQKVQDFSGKYLFKNIAKIALIVLTLPHSNAEAERVFSVVTDIKTKKKEIKLGMIVSMSVCVIRSKFSSEGLNCTNFKPNPKHFEKFNKDIYL